MEIDEKEMLPVLCGYFNKIIQALLTKEKGKLLEYLMIRKDGAIFDGLMKHIGNHSLALLMIELLQIQIKAESISSQKKAGKMSMYTSDGSDAENQDDEENEGVLTSEQVTMKDLLEKKGSQIVMGLLDCLSNKNQDELEKTLNANTVLMEFCDNDQCFAMLTSPEALQRLI